MAGRRGFTLIETLVVIAVIAILLGITIPVLRGALDTAEEVNDLANLRSTHQQFYEWGVDHKDRFVNRGLPVPGEPYVYQVSEHGGTMSGGYGGQVAFWTWTLGEWLGRGYPTWHPVNTPPLQPHEREALAMLAPLPGSDSFRPSDFHLSSPMLYDPRRFAPGCLELESHATARFVRWSETAFPGNKALLYNNAQLLSDTGAYPEDPRVAIVLVDGSARYASPYDAITIPSEVCAEVPFKSTPMGILGRDIP